MTTPTTDTTPTPYDAALLAVIVSSTSAILELLDSLPSTAFTERIRGVLARVIGLRLAVSNGQARSVAAWSTSAALTRVRGIAVPPDVLTYVDDVDRLTAAVETVLSDIPAPPTALDDGIDALLDRIEAEQDAARAADAAAAFTDLADLEAREAAADDAEIADLARQLRELDTASEIADAAHAHAVDEAARQRYLDARRAAARTRLQRLATEEAYRAANKELETAFTRAPEALGWVRQLTGKSCPTCIAWAAPTTGTNFSPVRPYTVAMKRHTGCDCVQRPVLNREEYDVRGFDPNREPVAKRGAHADASTSAHSPGTGAGG